MASDVNAVVQKLIQFRNDSPIEELMMVPQESDVIDKMSNSSAIQETEKLKFRGNSARNAEKVNLLVETWKNLAKLLKILY